MGRAIAVGCGVSSSRGMFYGVGVGPGDPELLTLKACRVIREVPVIAFPQLGDAQSTARIIAATHVVGEKREIAIRVPLSGGGSDAAYDRASCEIAEVLASGLDVAILCEGDPLVYGSFIAVWERLKNQFVCEIIPGVSSTTAAFARIQKPILRGQEALCVVPGTLDDAALEQRIAEMDCIAIVKVGRHIRRLAALVERMGLMDRAHYIERATLGHERHMPLVQFTADTAPYFSMILIGQHGEARP